VKAGSLCVIPAEAFVIPAKAFVSFRRKPESTKAQSIFALIRIAEHFFKKWTIPQSRIFTKF
jgi:hypothetical protein